MAIETGTDTVKRGLAQMLKGGVVMDVVTAEHAKVAEEAGAAPSWPSNASPPPEYACPRSARCASPEHDSSLRA